MIILSIVLILSTFIGLSIAEPQRPEKDPSKPSTKEGNCEYWVEKFEEFNSFKYLVIQPIKFSKRIKIQNNK